MRDVVPLAMHKDCKRCDCSPCQAGGCRPVLLPGLSPEIERERSGCSARYKVKAGGEKEREEKEWANYVGNFSVFELVSFLFLLLLACSRRIALSQSPSYLLTSSSFLFAQFADSMCPSIPLTHYFASTATTKTSPTLPFQIQTASTQCQLTLPPHPHLPTTTTTNPK